MIHVQRFEDNPILMPDTAHPWEAHAVLNASVVKKQDMFHIFYRAISNVQQWEEAHIRVSSIGHATGTDGLHFEHRSQFLIPEYDWERYGCEDPRIVCIDDTYYIFYTALSTNPPGPDGIRVGVALTKDLQTIEEKHLVTPFNAKAMVLFPEKVNGKYTALLTVDTDRPPAKIAIAQFDVLSDMWKKSYWDEWYSHVSEHTLPLMRRSDDQVEVGLPPIYTQEGWLLIYSYIQNYYTDHKTFGIEAVLLEGENILHLKARTNGPFMLPQTYPEKYGTIPDIIFPSGGVTDGDRLRLYYGASDTAICAADVSISEMLGEIKTYAPQLPVGNTHTHLHLTRFEGNPILSPLPSHPWEEKAVFNAGVIKLEDTVYILYRAMNNQYVSTLGLATTRDGFHIQERGVEPIYVPRLPFEINNDPGGSAGCEDPRLTHIGDRIYMHYTGYDGKVPRVVHTSISVKDFLARRWNWELPVAISNTTEMDKNSVLFPEKIQGKFVVLHRYDVRIWIDFVDNFSHFQKNTWLQGDVLCAPIQNMWDSEKIGSAGPPMKTPYGWLLIYHGISSVDHNYRLGMLLLDMQDPRKILFRSHEPILEPKLPYERTGVRPGAVFSCGSAVVDDTLFVYYGAGDSTLCVARYSYSELLQELKKML